MRKKERLLFALHIDYDRKQSAGPYFHFFVWTLVLCQARLVYFVLMFAVDQDAIKHGFNVRLDKKQALFFIYYLLQAALLL